MSSSLELITEQAWAVVLANAGLMITPSTADRNELEIYPKIDITSVRGQEQLSPQSGIFEITTTINLEHKSDDSTALQHAQAWENVLQASYWNPPIAYQLTNAVAGLTVFGVKRIGQARHEFDANIRIWRKSGQWNLIRQPLALPAPPPPVMEICFS